jgi:phosphate transport system ATP-binding protein
MPCTVRDHVMEREIKIKVDRLCFSYQGHQVLENVTAQFEENTLTAIVGPSGIGKSTFLTTLNRLWENIPEAKMRGEVHMRFDGRFHDVYNGSFPPPRLRRLVGMVFQTPNPLPMSVYKNIAFPLKLAGEKDKKLVAGKVEKALRRAYLWQEVKDRLGDHAHALSGGQQQRLCIARSLVLEPEVLLLDEPTSSLDSKAAAIIEELLLSLRSHCTLIVVSHYLEQVSRIADRVVELSDKKFMERPLGESGER